MRLLALCCLALAAGASSAQPGDTLEKIKAAGTITIGHRDSSIPFSYVLGTGEEPVGFAIDICKEVVSAVKSKLGVANLTVKYQTVTSQNRIPLVQNGTVDLECGSTTNSMARQQQVAFSPNYIVVGVSAAVKKSSGINSFADLAGKTIATTTGTTSIPLLRAYKKTESIEVSEIYGKDHSDSFLLLASDRASAFVMDDVLLAGQIAASQTPAEYKILPEALRQEPYGIMFRKDDPKLKALVDATVTDLMKTGRIDAMYAKWFTSPIPPRNVNLQFPMSEATKALYRNPTDKGV
ncbi:transporter substrate-binding domain-containing protein [Variovorax sp. LjRoot130]|uniref:transporter substrate-binding domain-containing protein n=1 Tax=Variovorax sp. LjRoot130 TaxID=3342261 RepID=UPI003ECCBFD2